MPAKKVWDPRQRWNGSACAKRRQRQEADSQAGSRWINTIILAISTSQRGVWKESKMLPAARSTSTNSRRQCQRSAMLASVATQADTRQHQQGRLASHATQPGPQAFGVCPAGACLPHHCHTPCSPRWLPPCRRLHRGVRPGGGLGGDAGKLSRAGQTVWWPSLL